MYNVEFTKLTIKKLKSNLIEVSKQVVKKYMTAKKSVITSLSKKQI